MFAQLQHTSSYQSRLFKEKTWNVSTFVHICRVCSGGNILVASNTLMFCILMSRAEIQPLSWKLWGIGPALLLLPSVKIWCICFGRWDSSVQFFVLWEFYSNEADRDNRREWYFWRWQRWDKKQVITATMRMVLVMMMAITTCHSFFWRLSEIASLLLFSQHFSSFRIHQVHTLSALLLPLHLYLCFPVWHSLCSSSSLFRSAVFPISELLKHARVKKKSTVFSVFHTWMTVI